MNEIGKEQNDSRENVRRYIRLTYLIPELLEKVDLQKVYQKLIKMIMLIVVNIN